MKVLRAGLALIFLAQASAAQRPALPGTLPSSAAVQDFDVLITAFKEAHGALYRFTPKAELDARFDSIRKSLSSAGTISEFHRAIARANAAIGDGHSRILWDERTSAAFNRAKVFPLSVVLEDNRVRVLSNDTPSDSTIRPGFELTSVNGRPMREVVSALLPLIARDGFIDTGRRYRFGRGFAMNYRLFIDTSETFTIGFRNESGRDGVVTLGGIPDSVRAANTNAVNATHRAAETRLRASRDNISLRFVSDSSVAVLRIGIFIGEPFPEQLDSAIRLARSAKGVVLDLRGNPGGEDMYGVKLVSEFATKPFRYFDRIELRTIRPSFATWKPSTFADIAEKTVPDPVHGGFLATPALHPGITEQNAAAAPFTGKLVVLMDGATFSTAADVTAVLRSMKRATFVGEESGGAYEGNTSGLNADVCLPNSGVRVRIQMYGYHNAVIPGPLGRGTVPDVEMPVRVLDVLAGRDPGMERALALAMSP